MKQVSEWTAIGQSYEKSLKTFTTFCEKLSGVAIATLHLPRINKLLRWQAFTLLQH